MKIIAKHYVPVAGRVYAPGEVIDRPVSEEQLQRLVKLNAVARLPEPEYEANMPGEDMTDGDIADDMPGEDMTDGIEDADVQDEAPIEIDVMDGIIPSDTPEKPKGKKGKA